MTPLLVLVFVIRSPPPGNAAKAEAVTRIVASQLSEEMKRQGITKADLAKRMHSSRAQVAAFVASACRWFFRSALCKLSDSRFL